MITMRNQILKSIFVAAFMATSFTIVTVGTMAFTSEQALAKKKDKKKTKKKKVEKVSIDTGGDLYRYCLAFGDHKTRESSTGRNSRCCSKEADFCVTCPNHNDRNTCKKRKYRAFSSTIFNKLRPRVRSGRVRLAPTARKR